MADLRAARRYASALFGVAVREKNLETVEEELNSLVEIWKQNPSISAAMLRPHIPNEIKKRIWSRILEGKVTPLVSRFIQMLVEKRRISLLVEINGEFQRLADAYRNIVRAEVTTAVPLSADQATELQAGLARRTGRRVELIPRVDPAIVGGVIVRIGDQVMDGSIRSQLIRLKRQLAGSRY
jgi:F-type H+-transporting ATPase subunit delta